MRTRLSQEAWVLSCTLFFNLVGAFIHVIVSDQCFSNINVLPGVRIKMHSAAVSLGGSWDSTFLTSSQVCYCCVPWTTLYKSTWQSEACSGLRRSLSYNSTSFSSTLLHRFIKLALFAASCSWTHSLFSQSESSFRFAVFPFSRTNFIGDHSS